MKYRKKPVVIEAMQVVFGKTKVEEVISFVGKGNIKDVNSCQPKIMTLEGEMLISDGDYVIKGVQGEFYPCKPAIFEATYEKADKPTLTVRTASVDIEEVVKKFVEKLEESIREVTQ